MRKEIIDCDYSLLKGRIKKIYGNQESFADVLGRTVTQVSNKLNGKADFTVTDVKRWCSLLSIPVDEIHKYFFCEEV